ncbi:hypothetical protein RI129_003444 [Pyrocoelia pectoralis]|uniref:Uncharacterized protein n=1 Tax=Pyrocoelia pectoralis TaxID=417401 RepID=A0AAN7VI16_9COLE
MSFLNESLEIRSHRSSFAPKTSLDTEEQREDSQQDVLTIDVPLTEGEYEMQDDGSLLKSPEGEEDSPTSCGTPRSRSTSRQSSITIDVPAKRKKNSGKNTNIDADMIMLEKVSQNLGEISAAVQKKSYEKTAEDIFGEFVATQLKKLTETEKIEAQYCIHGILRNALRKNN